MCSSTIGPRLLAVIAGVSAMPANPGPICGPVVKCHLISKRTLFVMVMIKIVSPLSSHPRELQWPRPAQAIDRMPRDGAITFSDLQGHLDLLRVDCNRCSSHRCYAVANLIDEYGKDAKFFDWLTRNCPKKRRGMVRACYAVIPELPELKPSCLVSWIQPVSTGVGMRNP